MMRTTLRDILSDAGYEVTTAAEASEALECSQSQKFDLITIDIIMPGMDGYELLSQLRKMEAYSMTPMILVSSKTEKINKMRGFDLGADDYITKPFDAEDLIKRVNKFMKK